MAKTTTKRYVFPIKSEKVWLKVGPLTWSMLPRGFKQMLIQGTENIARIREEISSSAKVRSMPPIEVVGELWKAKKGGYVYARGLPMMIEGNVFLGVQVPAQTAVVEDNDLFLLREVLLHEFLHCFHYTIEIVKAWEGGQPQFVDSSFDSSDKVSDRLRLARPEDWFGREDIECIGRERSCFDPFRQNYKDLFGLLPVVLLDPAERFKSNKGLSIEDDVLERVHQILKG